MSATEPRGAGNGAAMAAVLAAGVFAAPTLYGPAGGVSGRSGSS